MAQNLIDLLGQKFGLWFVMRREPNHSSGYVQWLCQCHCGNQKVVPTQRLLQGRSTKCKACAQWKGYGEISSKYWSQVKYHAKTKNRVHSISIQDAWNRFLIQGRQCALTGQLLNFARQYGKDEQTASLDRINSSQGYILNNIQWIHKDINQLKGNLSEQEFISLCNLVTSYQA
jgi:hypothetical protein